MKSVRKLQDIDKKCELLESLGFEIYHDDSHVGMSGVDFDFSAIACDAESIIRTAILKAYSKGVEVGGKEAKSRIREALGIEDKE